MVITTWSSGSWKDRRDRAGQRGRTRLPGVEPGDDDPALEATAVEVRHEGRKRADQRRLARPRGAEKRHDLARLERQRHVSDRRQSRRVREREAVDGD
jgi:hypothetical protein